MHQENNKPYCQFSYNNNKQDCHEKLKRSFPENVVFDIYIDGFHLLYFKLYLYVH